MSRRRQGVAAVCAAVLLAAGAVVAQAASPDACDAVYASNTIANLKRYEACRFDRIDASQKRIEDKLNAGPTPTPSPTDTPTAPSPDPTTPAPAPTDTPTPTQPPAPTPTGACTNPTITFTGQGSQGVGDGYDISAEQWAVKPGYQSTLKFCSKDSWNVDITAVDDGQHAVQSYPSIRKIFHDWSTSDFSKDPRLSSFPKLTADFAYADPGPCSGCIYETAFDNWLNGISQSASTEQMIWLHNVGQRPAGSPIRTDVTIDGRSWTVWSTTDHGIVSFVPSDPAASIASGTVDVRAFTRYQVDNGLIRATGLAGGATDPYVGQISLGVEPVATGGQSRHWDFNGFTVHTN